MKIPPLLASICCLIAASSYSQEPQPIWDEAVGGADTVFIEEMTAGEVAAAIRAGFTSVIVPTGGIEQNGPNVVTGKHNYVLRATADAIARSYAHTLVSPVVQFVPEGDIDPPSGHMRYPGTISLRQETFEALLTDICASLRQHGFTNIFLIGDSGGNQKGMKNVADSLNFDWADGHNRVHYIPEYYYEDEWSLDYLNSLGYVQNLASRDLIHTDLHYEAIIAVIDPTHVRADARLEAGNFVVHGVEIDSKDELVEIGRGLIEYRTDITVLAMHEAAAR